MSTQRTPSNKKFRELTSAEKEKKLYYQKLQIMNNRLKNLKQKQTELDVKIKTMKKYEQNRENFQTFKETNQREVNKVKSKNEKFQQIKKNFVQKEKLYRSASLKNALEKVHKEKVQKFNESKAEQMFTASMVTQYNSHNYNLKKCKYVKQKLNQVKYQTEKERKKAALNEQLKKMYEQKIKKEKNETSKLKAELEELEKFEEKCLKSLNQTMIYKNEMTRNYNKRLYDTNGKNKIRCKSSCGQSLSKRGQQNTYVASTDKKSLPSTNKKQLNRSMEATRY